MGGVVGGWGSCGCGGERWEGVDAASFAAVGAAVVVVSEGVVNEGVVASEGAAASDECGAVAAAVGGSACWTHDHCVCALLMRWRRRGGTALVVRHCSNPAV